MASLRHIVPVLGAIALIPTLSAADSKAPSVTFSGWADNILSVSDDNALYTTPKAKDEGASIARFTSQASLKANWKVGDDVSGKINVWMNPVGGSGDQLVLREAFALYQVSSAVGLQMGKSYSNIGLVGIEPSSLFTVNASIAGNYYSNYGYDPIGLNVILTPEGDKGPFTAILGVNNGNFTSSDAYSSSTTNANRQNKDLGYVLDLTYACCEMVKVNIETAYDKHSEINGVTNGLGGNIFYLGGNATLKPIESLTVGVEAQSFHRGTGVTSAGVGQGGPKKTYQGMLFANYGLSGTPFPMSVTLSDQLTVDINEETSAGASDGIKERYNGLQLALLTNPTNSSNFAVNLEVGYKQKISEDDSASSKTNLTGWETALEAYVSF